MGLGLGLGERAQWHRDVEEDRPVGIGVGVERVGVHEAAQVGGHEHEVQQPLVRHAQVLPLQRRRRRAWLARTEQRVPAVREVSCDQPARRPDDVGAHSTGAATRLALLHDLAAPTHPQARARRRQARHESAPRTEHVRIIMSGVPKCVPAFKLFSPHLYPHSMGTQRTRGQSSGSVFVGP